MNDTPVTYVVFDLLYLDGPLDPRAPLRAPPRALLERLELAGESWQTPGYQPGDAAELLEANPERGLEGMVPSASIALCPGQADRRPG